MHKADKKRSQLGAAARPQAASDRAPAQTVPLNFRSLSPNEIARLQRSIGNKATGRLLTQSRLSSPIPIVQRLVVEDVNSRILMAFWLQYPDFSEEIMEGIAKAIAEETEVWQMRGMYFYRRDAILKVLSEYVSEMERGKRETPTTAEGWLGLLKPHMVDELPSERRNLKEEQLQAVDEGSNNSKQSQGSVDKDREQFLKNAGKMQDADAYKIEGLGKMWDLGDSAQRKRILEVMGGDNNLLRMSSLEYFLEQVSPIHVGYGVVRDWFVFWTSAVLDHHWNTPWADFINDRVHKIKKKSTTGELTWMENKVQIIDSYDEETRAQYKLTPSNKCFYKADHQPLVGVNIYVLSIDNVWYGGKKEGPVHHSSFLQGAPVKCAGHLHTDKSGKLEHIDIKSGHYQPTLQDLEQALDVLGGQMDISDVKTGSYK